MGNDATTPGDAHFRGEEVEYVVGDGDTGVDVPLFERAIEIVLEHEGGFSDHPSDPGGATMYGISLRLLRTLGLGIGDIDGDGDIDIEDVRNLTKEQAKNIYRTEFWDPYDYESFHSPIAEKVFDLSVNMGPGGAHRVLQRALRAVGQNVVEDGILGPQTRGAVAAASASHLHVALRSEAAGYYRTLVAHNEVLSGFLRGWLNRAYS